MSVSRRILASLATLLLLLATTLAWHNFGRVEQAESLSGEPLRSSQQLGPFREISDPQPLAKFRFADADGRLRSLDEFVGKVLLLNIWATWCPPCRKEMPSLDRLQARMGGDDFQVLAISTDLQGVAQVGEFYQSAGISSLQLFIDHDGETESALKLPGLPTTFLIDREGKTIGVKVGPAEWDSEQVMAVIENQLLVGRSPALNISSARYRIAQVPNLLYVCR